METATAGVVMPLENVVQARFEGAIVREDWRLERGSRVIPAFAPRPVNDNLSFTERVKAEVDKAARAVGEPYTERELQNIAARAAEFARAARSRLGAKRV
jgi:hypothetical protein